MTPQDTKNIHKITQVCGRLKRKGGQLCLPLPTATYRYLQLSDAGQIKGASPIWWNGPPAMTSENCAHAVSSLDGDREAVTMMDLHVLCLTGEGVKLRVSSCALGCDVRRLVCEHLPYKAGGKRSLHHDESQLSLDKTLQEQGIVGKVATLSCTFSSTDTYAAWRFVRGVAGENDFEALDGVTELADADRLTCLNYLPQSLVTLTLGGHFNESLEHVLPRNLQELSLGDQFNTSLQHVAFPCSLRILTFGSNFNQSLKHVVWPKSLEKLTFGQKFNQRLQGVTWPNALQYLIFGDDFDQSLEGFVWPSGLLSLTLGDKFDGRLSHVAELAQLTQLENFLCTLPCSVHSLENVVLPDSLQCLTFGRNFAQCLENVVLPDNLQSLTLPGNFNHSLEGVTLPTGLTALAFGDSFNQSLEHVVWPNGLKDLTFGQNFNQTLKGFTFPSSLQRLRFGYHFDQSLDGVALPTNLQSLFLGDNFDRSLEHVIFPHGLQTLSLGISFKRRLEHVAFPDTLRTLTLRAPVVNSSTENLDLALPSTLQSLTFGALVPTCAFAGIPTLNFDSGVQQLLEGVIWPPSLQSLTFGPFLEGALDGMILPENLQQFSVDQYFDEEGMDRMVESLTLPSSLRVLAFGSTRVSTL